MNGDPTTTTAIFGGIFIASLLGSLHCAGMCGALVLFAVSGDDATQRKRAPLHLAYHAGRGISYTFLGLLAGSIGAAVDMNAALVRAQRPSAIVAGALMITFGAAAILKSAGFRGLRIKLPVAFQRFSERMHRAAFELPPVARAGGVGLLTPLLPCGWLYAFAIIAAGTGSPALGAVTMAVFWLGTVPILAALGLGLQTLTGPLRHRLPQVTAVIVITLGLFTALGRVGLPAVVPERIDNGSLTEQLQAVRQANRDGLPCCNPEPPPLARKP